MSFKSQSSHRGASRQYSKTAHEKKRKDKKQHNSAKYLQEEAPEITTQQVVEKTVAGLGRLGGQIFALSPFSQYYDDWLLNLRRLITEFQSNPLVKSDEQFEKECSRALQEVEGVLAEKRLQESTLTDEAKALADVNHKIADSDREYAEKNRELSNKRNAEVQKLSSKIRELEDSLSMQQDLKFGFFQFKEKKQAQVKLQQTEADLKSSKTQLEVTIASFSAEQEKLHDNYEKNKQELNEASDRVHKQLEKLETDTSTEARQTACNALIESVNALAKRMPQTTAPA